MVIGVLTIAIGFATWLQGRRRAREKARGRAECEWSSKCITCKGGSRVWHINANCSHTVPGSDVPLMAMNGNNNNGDGNGGGDNHDHNNEDHQDRPHELEA